MTNHINRKLMNQEHKVNYTHNQLYNQNENKD